MKKSAWNRLTYGILCYQDEYNAVVVWKHAPIQRYLKALRSDWAKQGLLFYSIREKRRGLYGHY